MRVWTVHARPGAGLALVPEKFSWTALVFGPLWLLAHRAWIAGVLTLAADIAITVALPDAVGTTLDIGLSWAIGLFGNDLRRWSLERRGFALIDVVAERSGDAALSRLLDRQPGLIAQALR